MEQLTRQTFRDYMVANFNSIPDTDYNKPTTKVFIIAYDYMNELEQQKVVDTLNDKIAELIGVAFQGAMKDIAKDIDISQGD